MLLRSWILFVLFALTMFTSSCHSKSAVEKEGEKSGIKSGIIAKGPPKGGTMKVEGYVVRTTSINESIEASGTLLPFDETDIHPEVAGRVVMLSIREGAFVTRGTILARLFAGDLQAQYHKLQVQLQVAQKTQQRQEQLLKIGGISQQDYDLSSLNSATIQADMQILQANLSKTTIRAPFNGKISFKNISIGAYITPATVVTTIRAVNKLKMEFSVPEKYESKVFVGTLVTFSVEGTSRKYAAKVIATESGITLDNRSLKVRALVENVDKYLTAGGFAKVIFNMGDNKDAIMIPTEAIIPGARDKKVIVDRMGSATFQTIQTGTRDSSRVQIVSGLSPGDTIIISGLLALKPGVKIQLTSIKK